MQEKTITILQEVRHLLAYAHHENEALPPCVSRALSASIWKALKLEGATPEKLAFPEPVPAKIPNVPDWRENAGIPVAVTAERAIAEIRRSLADDGAILTLSEQIDRILNLGITRAQLAKIMGVNRARITEAYNGHPRKAFLLRFAELFGNDGGASDAGGMSDQQKVRAIVRGAGDMPVRDLLDRILTTTGITGADLGKWLGISKKLISNVRCGRPSPAFTAAWNAFIHQEEK